MQSGDGSGVGAGVGSGVGAGVGAGVGSGVGAGVGAGVGIGAGMTDSEEDPPPHPYNSKVVTINIFLRNNLAIYIELFQEIPNFICCNNIIITISSWPLMTHISH